MPGSRAGLYQELSKAGDLWQGSLNEAHRKCDKEIRVCARPRYPGHVPQHI